MVSTRDLENVVAQVNVKFEELFKKIVQLEKQLGVTAAVAVDFSLLSQDFPSDFPSEQHDFFAGTIAVADFFDAQ